MNEQSYIMKSNNGNNLNNILHNYISSKGKDITHTRIGSKNLNVYGGSYNIPNPIDNDSEFVKKYIKHVLKNEEDEYLTEKQLLHDGPLLVDIDLRYNTSITSRQHKIEHIIDLIVLYAEKLNNIYTFDDADKINVYVLHKDNVVKNTDCTKDGIHIIFTIKVHKAVQVILRKHILKEIENMWDDIPIINTYDDVFDIGVTKGFVNWQVYGSKKPGCEKYKLTNYYTLKYEAENLSWNIDETHDLKNIDIDSHFTLMSARYNKHPEFNIKNDIELLSEIEKENNNLNIKEIKTENRKKNMENGNDIDNINEYLSKPTYITSTVILNKIIESLLNHDISDFQNEYEIIEIYNFVMILPDNYYNAGSFNNWIRVGWALKNTKLVFKLYNNEILFIIWMKMSSQSSVFDFNDIEKYYDMWKQFDANNQDGLTHRSIMYWAKISDKDKYNNIRKETVSYFIEQTIEKCTECGLADVLFQLYKERFVCVSVKNNIWYECKNGKWFEIDSGNSLRLLISKEMHRNYLQRSQDLMEQIVKLQDAGENVDKYKIRATKMGEIMIHLKTTSWKNNIMREAKELFYDKDFLNKLDSNPYLLSFNNYVVDFKTKTHRNHKPDDYISKSTNIDYIPNSIINRNSNKGREYKKIIEEIKLFMESLFPDKDLNRYMWEHLASVLLGTNQNQSFNIYTGSGCNGKSKLVEFMSQVLGEYKATVPITLITQSRNSIGSACPEIVQLLGVRYAVMQEPQKGDKINEGIMKEITGGDPIQGRALFKDTITFVPQFKLVVCTNVLFDIKTNDDGTWRRIRVCDFMSKFVDEPYENQDKFPKQNFPHQFKIDRKIDEKFILWAPVMASLLVDIVYKTDGFVKDCDIVMAVSDKYREGQDYLTEFAKEKIVRKDGSKIKKTEIMEEFKNWYIIHYGRNSLPNGKEITDYMDKIYGKCYRGKWNNVEIVYEEEELDDLIN